MTTIMEYAGVLLSLPSRPVSQNQICQPMVPFRVDGHIYVHVPTYIVSGALFSSHGLLTTYDSCPKTRNAYLVMWWVKYTCCTFFMFCVIELPQKSRVSVYSDIHVTIDIFLSVLQKHYRYLEAIALEHDEVEEVSDLTQPDQDRITRRAGALLEQFKELVYPSGYDPDQKPANKRKVCNKCYKILCSVLS